MNPVANSRDHENFGRRVLNYVAKVALAFWLGEMLFFAIIFAPRVFRILSRTDAGRLQNSIFPAYFFAGLLCGAILMVNCLAKKTDKVSPPFALFSRPSLSWTFLIFATSVFAIGFCYLAPELSALQPQVLRGEHLEEFQRLHRLSVGLNGAALLCLLILIGLF